MEGTKRVASDGAQMQTDNPSMPTRVLEEGTRINMHFGDTVIPGILNDSTTAQAFIEKCSRLLYMKADILMISVVQWEKTFLLMRKMNGMAG